MIKINDFVAFSQTIYSERPIVLHRPVFTQQEQEYVRDCITSNFVSSIGKRVDELEERLAKFVGVKKAVATVNGTTALHVALHCTGVRPDTHVLTQSLSFVATTNSISYCSAEPIFIDVDIDTLGMSPISLRNWLETNAKTTNEGAINNKTGKRIAACVPMHTFGLPCRIKEISEICREYNIPLIEDAAESLGSYVGRKHTGTFGIAGTVSFNGNKIITTGGGGAVLTNDLDFAKKIKHLTTTAKKPHSYDYVHDELGFNYRMPNINAAVGVAQIEKLNEILYHKKVVAQKYKEYFEAINIRFLQPINGTRSNYWLNGIVLDNRKERDAFLEITNANGVLTRPIWNLLSTLPMYKDCDADNLKNSKWLADRVVNLPSSVPKLD